MNIRHTCFTKEYIEVCRADFLSSSPQEEDFLIFDANAELLQFICDELSKIKASDMPNFETLPKDENFKNLFREYKINVLKSRIDAKTKI